MKQKQIFQAAIVLVISVLFLSSCGGQGAGAPTTAATEAAPAASPTPAPVAGIETPIKIAGAEIKITLATTDEKAYETGLFSVRTDPGFALMHIEAAIISGQPDLEALSEDISLADGLEKDCPLAGFGGVRNEKTIWEFIVPEAEKSFTLKFGDGQAVMLDSIFNKTSTTSAPAPVSAEPSPAPSATAIPPTPEPSILIRLGPGKFGKAMWLEVLKGDYQIVGGTTLRTGSTIDVNEDWLNFPPGLAIDVVGTSVTLKGTLYPDGSQLLVDASGNLVLRGAGGPSAPAGPDSSFNRVLISDNFNDSSKGWPEGRVMTVYWKGDRVIEDGIYTIKGVSMSGMYSYAYTGNGEAWDEVVSDQRASVKVKLAESPLDGAAGMTLRLDDSGSTSNFYMFGIASDGFAFFFKVYNDEWTPLMDWTQIDGLAPEDWNTLMVEASGSHFRLFINDELVGELDDSSMKEGRTALYVETYNSSVSFEVQFDDFEIRLPK